jgi:peptide chain release factor subunit 1
LSQLLYLKLSGHLYREDIMLTNQELQELIAYRPGYPVLSVYLNVDPSAGSSDAYKLRLRQLLKDIEETASDDKEIVVRFIEHEYDWSGRSLAIFSCAQDYFFRSYSLSLPVRSRARCLNRPYVKPLADFLDNYGNLGVALVDKQSARLFHFHLGELREQKGTKGEVVRHTKRGGGSQAPGRRGGTSGQTRYAEEVADRNLKEAARFATRFFEEKHIRRVLVGGTEANVARFISQLPKTWQSLIMGSFPMEMTAGHAQVLQKAMEVGRATEQEKVDQLIDAAITAAAKGREGVIRLDDTLGAVRAGNVQTLMISEGFRAPGFRCQSCGYLTTQELEQCVFCGSSIERIDDAVELAVRKVLSDGGEVEVIRGSRKLEQAGQICALLRY